MKQRIQVKWRKRRDIFLDNISTIYDIIKFQLYLNVYPFIVLNTFIIFYKTFIYIQNNSLRYNFHNNPKVKKKINNHFIKKRINITSSSI